MSDPNQNDIAALEFRVAALEAQIEMINKRRDEIRNEVEENVVAAEAARAVLLNGHRTDEEEDGEEGAGAGVENAHSTDDEDQNKLCER